MANRIQLSRKQLTVGVIILALIGLVGYCSRKDPTDLDDPIERSNRPPKEYLDLFALNNRKLLIPDEVHYFKKDYPIAGFYFDHKKYVIQTYKLGKVGNESLKNVISIIDNMTSMPSGLKYHDYGEELLEVMSRPYKGNIKNLHFNINRDSLNVIANNDSVVYVYAGFKDFSLQYNNVDTIRMYAKTGNAFPGSDDDNNRSAIPVIVTFLKKNNSVYLLIMSVNQNGLKLKPDLLYNLINGGPVD